MSPGKVTSTNVIGTNELVTTFLTTAEPAKNRVKQVEGRKLTSGDAGGAISCSLADSFTKLLNAGGESESLEVVQNTSPKLKLIHSESSAACGQTSKVSALVKKDDSLQSSRVVTAERFIELMRNNQFAADIHYIVDSSLDLRGLENVILPASLHIKGDIRIGPKHINVLPENLLGYDIQTAKRNQAFILASGPGSDSTEFIVDVPDDTDIGYLSDNLIVDGMFVASNCSKWLGFGNKTLIMGDCKISDCKNFESPGKQFEVRNGSLSVRRCPGFKLLPETLSVQFSVTMNKTGLVHIPENMKFNGSLNLIDCDDFKSIGSGVSVGSVIIENCKSFTQWPIDMTVQKSIYLTGLPGVMVFPEVLKLDRDFKLSEISVKLPHDLSVGRDLMMTATEIINLDDDIKVKVKSHIDLENTYMKQVPSWLNNCFEPDPKLLMPHQVYLQGTGLTRAGSKLEDSNEINFHFDKT
ncbi:hypothetical protein [Salinisphaera sp. G21_0]|uniref:hypothetical protein n=1 Tax=Salinisphaera sp. G21_0 TaxID=2821094 RepID=UPI001ADAC4EA|nr:hypothetical protein [Salinisphaera sp. G21_0]MBO9479912.1 hypothetical protein [Salinisphaera sp. G21_0]